MLVTRGTMRSESVFSMGTTATCPFLMSEQNSRTNKLFSPYMHEVTFKHYDKLKFTLCDFYSSDWRFAHTFLQIPSHDRHPWRSAISFPLLRLTKDFHPLECTHARRTYMPILTYSPWLKLEDSGVKFKIHWLDMYNVV